MLRQWPHCVLQLFFTLLSVNTIGLCWWLIPACTFQPNTRVVHVEHVSPLHEPRNVERNPTEKCAIALRWFPTRLLKLVYKYMYFSSACVGIGWFLLPTPFTECVERGTILHNFLTCCAPLHSKYTLQHSTKSVRLSSMYLCSWSQSLPIPPRFLNLDIQFGMLEIDRSTVEPL